MKQRTTDRGNVHTVDQLGPRSSMTPEGFLLYEDVAAARTGTMLYGPNETPVKVGPDGVARVSRDDKALFDTTTMKSITGKPVVNDHPDTDVSPRNWREFTVGLMLNPRRGEGDDKDVLLVDLLLTDASTISAVKAGKREVSLGYEADYEQTGEGTGRQTNIIVNHIALVERGRCGPRCAISDHDSTTHLKEHQMGTSMTRRRISDKVAAVVRKTFRDAEEEALKQLGNSGLPDDDENGADDGMGGDDDHTHIHIHTGAAPEAPAAKAGMEDVQTQDDPVEARFQAIEQTLAQMLQMLQGASPAAAQPNTEDSNMEAAMEQTPNGPAPGDDGGALDGGTEGENMKDAVVTKDSAALATAFQELIADAEVLVPGFRVPTFDAAKQRKATIDTMCRMRKSVLDHMGSTTAGTTVLVGLMPQGTKLNTLDCASAATVFKAAAATQRILNNRTSVGDAFRLHPHNPVKQTGAVRSIADLNRLHSEYHSKKK